MKFPDDYINKIICGDSLTVLKTIPDKSIDLILTSPPYDSLGDYDGYEFNFEEIAKEIYRITKLGGVLVWVVGDSYIDGSESGTSFKQALYLKKLGFNLHDTMIYEKNGFSFPQANRYEQCFEYMFVFSVDSPKTFNPIIDRMNTWRGEKSFGSISHRKQNGELVKNVKKIEVSEMSKRFNIWRYNTGFGYGSEDGISFEHPATFPDKLAIDNIKSWSNKNDVVLDPFLGSGTTAVACKDLDRKYIGIEISEKYCEIARKRVERHKSNLRLFP